MTCRDCSKDWSKSTLVWLLLLAVGAAAVVAWTEARTQTFTLPLLVLACALMHLFMHRGHRRHHSSAPAEPMAAESADANRQS
jgi:hypothetical protein